MSCLSTLVPVLTRDSSVGFGWPVPNCWSLENQVVEPDLNPRKGSEIFIFTAYSPS